MHVDIITQTNTTRSSLLGILTTLIQYERNITMTRSQVETLFNLFNRRGILIF